LRFKHRAALFFAQTGGRAQHAAGSAQNVVFFYRADGPGNIFKAEFSNKFRRLCVSRASFGAGGVMAEQTAIGFGKGLRQVKPSAHLFEFIGSTHNFSSLIYLLDFAGIIFNAFSPGNREHTVSTKKKRA
jgi:hypothetical protein